VADTKIIVLDDDPTGSQTVHGCLLLTRWDIDTLKQGLLDASPLFFILTNTRGMEADRAAKLTREVCRNLEQALREIERQGVSLQPIIVSRSDSTLRGHYPVETDVIAHELGPFDAHFIVPAFFEGGRITRDGVHFLLVDGKPVPVHETEFAKDSVFGYQHSFLPDYVDEKTRGRIKAGEVRCFSLQDVRGNCLEQLMALHNNTCCVVDAVQQSDLDNFCRQLTIAASKGKRYLFRSAASLLTAFAQLPSQPIKAEHMAEYVRDNKPGAIIVGSHVKKTTAQVTTLLARPGTAGVEIDVERLHAEYSTLLEQAKGEIAQLHACGLTPVIYTSRNEKKFATQRARLEFGELISRFLMELVRTLPATIGFIISKGGITSNDVLSIGLELRTSRVLGQILPGCSVVRCPANHPRFSNLPVVIFPGNVGDDGALAKVYDRLVCNAQTFSVTC